MMVFLLRDEQLASMSEDRSVDRDPPYLCPAVSLPILILIHEKKYMNEPRSSRQVCPWLVLAKLLGLCSLDRQREVA